MLSYRRQIISIECLRLLITLIRHLASPYLPSPPLPIWDIFFDYALSLPMNIWGIFFDYASLRWSDVVYGNLVIWGWGYCWYLVLYIYSTTDLKFPLWLCKYNFSQIFRSSYKVYFLVDHNLPTVDPNIPTVDHILPCLPIFSKKCCLIFLPIWSMNGRS